MTVRLSSAMRSFQAQYGSVAQALHGGKLKIYSGSQPANADAAPTGTLLCTLTDASGSHTAEVLATGTLTLSGSSGSINTVTVNSVNILGTAVAFDTDLATTAAKVAAQINRYRSNPKYKASASGAVVTISALPGTGAGPNTYVVGYTATTMTAVAVDLSGGVNAANGLKWGDVLAGMLAKLSTQTWSGVNAANGTAGWFRFESAQADSGAQDTTEGQLRVDGSIATSGADLNLSNGLSFASGATTTLGSFSITVPAA